MTTMARAFAVAALASLWLAPGFVAQLTDSGATDAATAEAMAIANQAIAETKSGQFIQDSQQSLSAALQNAGISANQVPLEARARADATNAHRAATQAKEAAKVATKVADHSIQITEHAKSALKDAKDALHKARVDSDGLSVDQQKSLREAEKKLRQATKAADYGEAKQAKDQKHLNMEKKMKEKQMDNSELEAMRKEIDALRRQLEEKGDSSDDEALKELEKQIKDLEAAEKKEDKADAKSHDEMKAEIERLRELINEMEKKQVNVPTIPKKPVAEAAAVEEKGLDIDTAMPYGDLEPFGREDTAQELTENSIKESDEMVDQLERAEVAEEKRAVFRALTRLRGAAITSFDGVARSQTGNIDEYNKIHQWRDTHPLHHLADEESDVSKWAFPDNAD